MVADLSCPYCNSTAGLTIVGSRSASLSSVALSQIFGSPYNDDKKAMAFSDSVQDASHRAGFFSARTYPIAVRTALQEIIDQQKEPISLKALSDLHPPRHQAQGAAGRGAAKSGTAMYTYCFFKKMIEILKSSRLVLIIVYINVFQYRLLYFSSL